MPFIAEIENRFNIKLKRLKKYDLEKSYDDKTYALDDAGNVVWLNLNGCNIDSLDFLKDQTSLRYLSVVNNKIARLQGLDSLINLEVLYIWNNPAVKIEGLSQLKKLQKLRVGGLKTSKIEGLDNLTGLTELSINCNNISTIEGLDNLPQLKKLRFIRSNIEKIQGLDNLLQLEELDLQYAKVKKLENLNNLSNLKILKVSGGISKIENIDNLTELEELNLSLNKIQRIENIDNQKKLQKLSLSNNNISVIENVSHLTQLKTLDLSNNRIEFFTGFENSSLLEKIDLGRNALKKMNGFEQFGNLKYLDLSRNEIKKRVKLNASVYVDLSDNPMTIKLKQYKNKDVTIDFLISNLYNIRGFDTKTEKDFYEVLSDNKLNYNIEDYSVFKTKINDELSFKIEYYPGETIYYVNEIDVAVQSGHFELWFLRWKELQAISQCGKKNDTAYFFLLLPITAIEPEEQKDAENTITEQLQKLSIGKDKAEYLSQCITNGLLVPQNTFIFNQAAGIHDSTYNHSNRKYRLYKPESINDYVNMVKQLELLAMQHK